MRGELARRWRAGRSKVVSAMSRAPSSMSADRRRAARARSAVKGTLGIRTPGLMAWGSAIQASEVLGVVGDQSLRLGSRGSARWLRSGPTMPPAACLRQYGSWRTGRRTSPGLARPRRAVGGRRRQLTRAPGREVGGAVGDHKEGHAGVLQAAELGALAAIAARRGGLDPGDIGDARDHVHLPGQLRDPEGMDHVGR